MKKALKISLYVFLFVGVAAYFGCLIWYKEPTIEFTEKIKDFINRPLPIVGISLVILGTYAFKLISVSKYGKAQIEMLKKEAQIERENFEAYKETLEQEKNALKEQYELLKSTYGEQHDLIVKICNTIPNKKVKELVNGKEKEDSQAD